MCLQIQVLVKADLLLIWTLQCCGAMFRGQFAQRKLQLLIKISQASCQFFLILANSSFTLRHVSSFHPR